MPEVGATSHARALAPYRAPLLVAVLLAALLALWLPGMARATKAQPDQAAYRGFFPPVLARGQVRVTLHPNPAVLGKLNHVSFGAPFPPGFVSDPRQIRLLDDAGQEVPLFVRVLARWPEPVPGAGSIRSALVQFRDLMESARPRVYRLVWGSPRARSEPQGWPARTGWLPVTDGTYPPGKVYDPPVYMTFPAGWLGLCLLKGRMLPAGQIPQFRFYDRAMTAMADTVVNRFEGPVKPKQYTDYLKKYSVWLYDRPAALFVTYFRTGEVRFLRDAHRAAQFYADNVEPDGRFALLPPKRRQDMKYALVEGLALDYWLFGDPRLKIAANRALKQLNNWRYTYVPGGGHWTERHLALALLIATTGYELTGDPQLLKRAADIFSAGYAMQTSPPPGAPRDGCMIHLAKQHGVWAEGWYCCPWMSALLVDGMLRYYIVSADPRVPHSVVMLADFVAAHGTYRTRLAPKKPLEFNFPHNLVSSRFRMKSEMNPWDGREHAMDVSKILAAGIYFNRKAGKSNPALQKILDELLTLARWNFDTKFPRGYLRWQLPKAVVKPPRKFGWWFRTTADLDWLLSQK